MNDKGYVIGNVKNKKELVKDGTIPLIWEHDEELPQGKLVIDANYLKEVLDETG